MTTNANSQQADIELMNQWPRLSEVFASYFHQDWREDYPTAAQGIQQFCREATTTHIQQVAIEIAALIQQNAVTEQTIWQLGGNLQPEQHDESSLQWFTATLQQLEAELKQRLPQLLDFSTQPCSMRLVYTLAHKLIRHPEYIAKAQRLTLDNSRPHMGLKGSYGLYGSDEWWQAIYQQRMPLRFVAGTISRTYYAGMDSDRRHNSYELTLADGTSHHESFLADDAADLAHFTVGKRVYAVYALDELKQSHGSTPYSLMPVEIALAVD